MTQPKFYLPLKISLLVVSLTYFLFTFHAMFTLSWIGEWEHLGVSKLVSLWILITDISAAITLVFRLTASFIAVAAVVFYLTKKSISTKTIYTVLRWILILEAVYWLGLLPSGVWGVLPAGLAGLGTGGEGLAYNLGLLITTGIPCLVSSITIPFALFKLVSKLNPNKLMEEAIQWGLIVGAIYIFVFWLNNAGIWIVTVMAEGTEYLTTYPANLLSFTLTIIGLLVLAIFTAYFAKASFGPETLTLKLKPIGAILVALGSYYLWNYLTWIFFGGDYLWSSWYAWFLGHNLDLWMLSLPLVGLTLLFEGKSVCIREQN